MRRRGFRPSSQGSNQDNWRQGQGNQGRNYGKRNGRNGPYVPPQNREVTPRNCGDSMARVEDMLHKIMRRFDANDDHIKELMSYLAIIGRKVDTHAISIKHIELQMAQLSATVNIRQPGTLTSNTVQNLKNDGHCTAITTRGGKQTIDPPMPSKEEKVIKR